MVIWGNCAGDKFHFFFIICLLAFLLPFFPPFFLTVSKGFVHSLFSCFRTFFKKKWVAMLQRTNFMQPHKAGKLLLQDNKPLERTCLLKPLILNSQNFSLIHAEHNYEIQQIHYRKNCFIIWKFPIQENPLMN